MRIIFFIALLTLAFPLFGQKEAAWQLLSADWVLRGSDSVAVAKLPVAEQKRAREMSAIEGESLFQQGLSLFNNRQWLRADAAFSQVLLFTPNQTDAWLARCAVAIEMQQLAQAQEFLQHARMLSPASPSVYRLQAQMYLLRKQWPQALSALDSALHASPNEAGLLKQKAWILSKQGVFVQSATAYTEVAKQLPRAQHWFEAGEAWRLAQDTSQAVAAYEQALALDGKWTAAYLPLALLVQHQRPEQAMEKVNAVLATDSTHYLACHLRGVLHYRQSEWKKHCRILTGRSNRNPIICPRCSTGPPPKPDCKIMPGPK